MLLAIDDYASVPKITLPEDEEDPKYDLMWGIKELESAIPTYDRANLYYNGRVSEWHADPDIARILSSTSEGYPLKLAGVPVDAFTDRVQLTRVQVDKSIQDDWDDIFEANDMEAWSVKQLHSTFLHGDAYIRVWPSGTDDEDEARIVDAGAKITYLSPYVCRVIYGDDDKTPEYAIHRWKVRERLRCDVVYRDRTERWITSKDGEKGHTPGSWVPYNEEGEPHVEDHPPAIVGELPIKHSRTDLPYGRPVHEPAYGPQNAIMKHLITELSVVDQQGWPARMLLADPSSVLDQVAADGPEWADEGVEEEGVVEPPEDREVQHRPGVIQILNGIRDAKTFEAADLDGLIKPVLSVYLPIMSAVTRVPLSEFDSGGAEQPSGRARSVRDAPFRGRAERLKALLTDFWEEVTQLAIRVAGHSDPSSVEVGWKTQGVAADKETWEAIHMMLSAGVPFDVVMTQAAGFDPATVRTWPVPQSPVDGGVPGVSNGGVRSGGAVGGSSNPTKMANQTKAQEGPK